MVEAMKKVAALDVELTIDERNLLSVGYKNVIGARRASWRILSSIEQKEESRGNEQNAKRIKDYRTKVEDELSKICYDILAVIDKHLVPSATSGESTVFYYKMSVLDLISNQNQEYTTTHALKSRLIGFWIFVFDRKGDYLRYLAEFKSDADRDEAADQSLKAYEVCFTIFSLDQFA